MNFNERKLQIFNIKINQGINLSTGYRNGTGDGRILGLTSGQITSVIYKQVRPFQCRSINSDKKLAYPLETRKYT